MMLYRVALVLAAGVALTACSLPNPYSSRPAPVRPVTPGPVQPGTPVTPVTPPAPQLPVIDLPSAPEAPLPEVRSVDLERLVDNLAGSLKRNAAINEVQGPVLLDDISNQAGSPVDTQGLTERLRANLSGSLSFADGARVSSLRQQLAYQDGRADMAALVRLGKQSGADYLLSTTLTRNGDSMILQGQLMELSSGEVLWSDRVSGR
ncbi:penicillin-binding protein activator LpoB [Oceanisphaera psychrotolerans]|uniref:Penicillin-binding protein activator LpoB n=1 Tax=Oceanisphaera psychrotolerans TaxID=1414654 RepID=A0A1J4QFL2_9GAMM|nr:penicillin-binding protein activator LpoB [Oceanisphaera psychrotolerans]OIN09218.1 penicillin-binding protein activator LpoB [Oceanisphaera psychrotolerans]